MVGILGLSYKPGTPVIENSQGINLAKKLNAAGFNVKIHDELAKYDPANDGLFGVDRLICAETLIEQCDTIVLMTPSKFYCDVIENANDPNSQKIYIDPWRILDSVSAGSMAVYMPMGNGSAADEHLQTAAE